MSNLSGRYILMLEHDDDDRLITSSAIKESGYDINIIFVNNTDEIYNKLLEKEHPPVLIILDLHMPTTESIKSIQFIKRHPAFCHIPVIIVSGSGHPAIVTDCYRAGANSFFTKPITNKKTTEKINVVLDYWLHMAELPENHILTN